MQEQTPPPSFSSAASTSQDASAGVLRPSIISPRAIRARSRSLGPANTMALEDVEAARRASVGRVLDVWASLAERYGHVALDADDEIDISTGEVVRDRGVLRRLRESKPIGGRVEESEDSVSSDDCDDDSEDELGRLYDEPPAPTPQPSFRGPSVARDPQRDEQELHQFLQDEQMRKRNAIIMPDGSTEAVSETGSEARTSTTPDDLETVAGPSTSRASSAAPVTLDTSDEGEDYDSHDELALVDDPPDTPFTSPVKSAPSASAANKFLFLTPPRSQSADPRRPVDRVTPLPGHSTVPRHSPVHRVTPSTQADTTPPGRPRLTMEVVLPRRSDLMGPPSSTPRRPGHAHRLSSASSTTSSSDYPGTPSRTKVQTGFSRATALPSPAPTDSSVRNSDSVEEIDLVRPRPSKVYGRKSLSRSNSAVVSSNRHTPLPTPPPLYSSSSSSSSSPSKGIGLPTPSASSTPSRFDDLPRPPIPVPLPARVRDVKGKGKALPQDDPSTSHSFLTSDTEEEGGHDILLLSSPMASPARLPSAISSHDEESPPPPRVRSPARPRTGSSSPRKRRRSANSADEAQQRDNPPSPTKRRTMESSRHQSSSSSRASSSRPQQLPPPPLQWPHAQPPAGMPLFASGHGYSGPNTNANLMAQFLTGVQQMSVLAQAVMPGLFVQQPPPPGAVPMMFGMPGGGGFAMQHPPPVTPTRHQQQHYQQQQSPQSSPRPRSQSPPRSRSILRTPSSSRVRKRVSFLLERERSASLDGDDAAQSNMDGGGSDSDDDERNRRRGREKLRVKGTPAPGNGRRGWSQDR